METKDTPSAADEAARTTTKAETCTELARSADIEARRRDGRLAATRHRNRRGERWFSIPTSDPAQIAVVIREINLIHDNPQVTPAEVERRRFEGCMKSAP